MKMHGSPPQQVRSQLLAKVPLCRVDISTVQRAVRAAHRWRDDIASAEATLADALDTLARAREVGAQSGRLLIGSVPAAAGKSDPEL